MRQLYYTRLMQGQQGREERIRVPWNIVALFYALLFVRVAVVFD